MATYKGNDIVQPDRLDADRKLMGKRYRGFDNVEEELGLPEEAGPDYVPRPGQKGYMDTKPMASDGPKRIIATPRDIRPRSTPNAEINAQERMKVLRDMGAGYPLAPNQSYAKGGMVKHGSSTRVTCTTKSR